MRTRAILALTCLAAALSGCGNGQLPAASGLDPADQILNQAAVDKTPTGPERALYQWWLYVQFNDRRDYLRMLAPGLRKQKHHTRAIQRVLPAASRSLDAALPNLLSLSRNGNRATIYTSVVYHQLVGSRRFISVQAPQAFSLVHVAGRWYIADDRFIAQAAR